MSKKLGIFSILLGMACLLASAGFVFYNRMEAQSGAEFSRTLLQDVQENVVETAKMESKQPENATEEVLLDTEPRQMRTIPAGEYESIGILSIPALELELPVLTDWSYEKLKKAPCHYYGSYYEGDFVIAAHNYKSHFGRLSELQPGDIVLFTDAQGVQHSYRVVLLETLPKEATLEMITSGFDLSLYTCTPGGASRVTVRCNRIQ